jgi:hypothetical protein
MKILGMINKLSIAKITLIIRFDKKKLEKTLRKKTQRSRALVTYIGNPSYSGGRDQGIEV